MANTFSSVPYEKTAQQRSIANRLEPIAIRYWQQGDELRQASQALVNTDVNDAPKFRDACTAVGRVLVATGLAELPAKFSEASARSVGTHWHARYAIGRLLDAALKQNWEVFEETYIWITNAPDSMLLFEEKLLDQLQWLMTQRYVQIAPACYAEAQSIVDESGEVFIALQDPPYYRYPSAGYLTNQASEAVNHWEGFRLGTGFHTSHGYPVRKAKPAMPTEIEQLRQYFDVAVGPGVPETTAVANGEVKPGATKKCKEAVPKAEAEILVREWFIKNQKRVKENPASITRDGIAAETGVSTRRVSESPAWIAFRDERDAHKQPKPRNIQLTDAIVASTSETHANELALRKLVEEQTAEMIVEAKAQGDDYRRRTRSVQSGLYGKVN